MRLITHVCASTKSPFHAKNEDKILVIKDNKYSLYFLFDGVSSAAHALDAVEMSCDFIYKNYKKYEHNEMFKLSNLMQDTHLQLIKSDLTEILSTYVAMFIPNQENQKVSISSMGDSRIYGISEQYIVKHTEDDNIPNIDNVITKSLGMPNLKIEDFNQKDFLPKESKYLICSDGFYKLMNKNIKKFYKIFNFSRLGNIKKTLQKSIVKNEDDASYILIKIHV